VTRRTEFAVLIAGLLLLAVVAYGRQTAVSSAQARSVYSTFDSGPNGYRALYATLRRAGVPVRQFGRTLGLLDSGVSTLVISSYEDDPARRGLDPADAARLKRFVSRGGRLVVLDTDFAGTRDFTPGVGTSRPVTANAAIALTSNRYTAGVTQVRGPIDAAFPFAAWRGAVPLLANDRGVVATVYRLGKGEVVAISAPPLFGNAHLLDADNLAFAYDVVAGHGPIAFDEYVHGYDDDAGFWQVLPQPVRIAAWIVGAIVLLGLVGANVPFAPPIAADAPDERNSAAFVDAMGALLRRARAAGAVIAAFAADAARRTRGRTSTPGVSNALAELERLRAVRPPSDAAVLRAAILDFRLRKDFP
jgi:hypothetical protein